MPNATVQANAEPMLIDRRAALGALVAAGALLAAPAPALAAHPDAEIFALARRAKALSGESAAADMALDDLDDAFEPPDPPSGLLIREGDEVLVGVGEDEFAGRLGAPFPEHRLHLLTSREPAWRSWAEAMDASKLASPALRIIKRAAEIDLAARRHRANIEAARIAAGLPEAEARADEIRQRLRAAWRDLAFTPARTVAGVLAKLAAVASQCRARDPEQACDRLDESAVCVLEMAALDLAALKVEA